MKKIFVIMLCILPMMAFAQEFGVFNRAEIFQAMPETQEAIKKLDQLAKNYEDDLLALREEYQKKGSEFVAQRDSMPELIRTRRMAEIQEQPSVTFSEPKFVYMKPVTLSADVPTDELSSFFADLQGLQETVCQGKQRLPDRKQ